MTTSTTDDDWEWVVPPESGNTAAYSGSGNDLSDNITLGERLYKLRTQAGLTPQDVEDYAGVKKADVLALEAGLLQMNASLVSSLAIVLGVDPDDIAG